MSSWPRSLRIPPISPSATASGTPFATRGKRASWLVSWRTRRRPLPRAAVLISVSLPFDPLPEVAEADFEPLNETHQRRVGGIGKPALDEAEGGGVALDPVGEVFLGQAGLSAQFLDRSSQGLVVGRSWFAAASGRHGHEQPSRLEATTLVDLDTYDPRVAHRFAPVIRHSSLVDISTNMERRGTRYRGGEEPSRWPAPRGYARRRRAHSREPGTRGAPSAGSARLGAARK